MSTTGTPANDTPDLLAGAIAQLPIGPYRTDGYRLTRPHDDAIDKVWCGLTPCPDCDDDGQHRVFEWKHADNIGGARIGEFLAWLTPEALARLAAPAFAALPVCHGCGHSAERHAIKWKGPERYHFTKCGPERPGACECACYQILRSVTLAPAPSTSLAGAGFIAAQRETIAALTSEVGILRNLVDDTSEVLRDHGYERKATLPQDVAHAFAALAREVKSLEYTRDNLDSYSTEVYENNVALERDLNDERDRARRLSVDLAEAIAASIEAERDDDGETDLAQAHRNRRDAWKRQRELLQEVGRAHLATVEMECDRDDALDQAATLKAKLGEPEEYDAKAALRTIHALRATIRSNIHTMLRGASPTEEVTRMDLVHCSRAAADSINDLVLIAKAESLRTVAHDAGNTGG